MAGPYSAIVVPGILGTQLSFKGLFAEKQVAWFNPALLASLSPLAIALAGDGHSPWPLVGQACFADGPVGIGSYEPLLTSLRKAGHNPYFWGYDWRLDIRTNATQLAAAFLTLPLTDPFNVVTLSMGGLVAQLAYPQWLAAGNHPQWKATYYLNCPQGGSHFAARCLNGLFVDGSLVAALAACFNVISQSYPTLGFAYTAVSKLLGLTIGSWPALYGLLPSNLGIWQGRDPLAGRALQLATYADGPGGVQQQWLTAALAVQQALVAGYSTPRPEEWSLNGTGISTPRAFQPNGDYSTLSGYVSDNAGDGVVANERSALPTVEVLKFRGTSHNGISASFVVLEKLEQLLADVTIPPTEFNDFITVTPTQFVTTVPPPPIDMSTWAGTFANRTQDP